MRLRPVAAACAVAAASALAASAARADAIDVCVSAATGGQQLQRAGRLREARAQFLRCVNPQCPAQVSAVCNRLLDDVEASLPTVVFAARDARGADLAAVRVLIDGTPLPSALDGKAVAIDPGAHLLRFEHAGSAPVEQRVVLRETEKNRRITATFPPPDEPRRVPLAAWAMGAVGVASLATFAVLAIDGQRRYNACNPHACTSSAVDGLGVERAAAWGALGLGVIATGAAAWLFLGGPGEPRRGGSVVGGLGPVPGGAVLSAAGAF